MTSYILLSAGIGRSIKTKGTQNLITFNHIPVLQYQIDTIRKFDPLSDIIVVIGFQYEKVLKKFIDHDVRFVVNHEFKDTNQSHSLRLGINCSRKSNIKVVHGDIIFSEHAISGCGNHVVKYETDTVDKRKIGIIHNNELVTNLAYGIGNQWGQIFGVDESDYNILKQISNTSNSSKSTFEIINLFISRSSMSLHKTRSKIIEIDKKYEDITDMQTA